MTRVPADPADPADPTGPAEAAGALQPEDEQQALERAQARLLARRREVVVRRAPAHVGASLPMERAPAEAIGRGEVPLRLAIGRYIQGLPPLDGQDALALKRLPRRKDDAPAPEAVRAAWLARAAERGVPPDPGVLAVALADRLPDGEALRIVVGHMRAREKACLADWRASHPGERPPEEPPPATVGLLLFVVGDNDTGKTAAGGRVVTRHRRGALYIRANAIPPLDEAMRGVAFDRQEQVARQRERLLNVDLLVVDEVGVEADPSLVTELACMRWPRKATVLLGNVGGEDAARRAAFWQRYADPRFVSRIRDRQDARVVGSDGGYRVIVSDRDMHLRPTP